MLSSGGAIAGKFRNTLSEFKRLIEKCSSFHVSQSTWFRTLSTTGASGITPSPLPTRPRRSTATASFTVSLPALKTQELALKYLLLLDCLAIILLQDQLVRGVLT